VVFGLFILWGCVRLVFGFNVFFVVFCLSFRFCLLVLFCFSQGVFVTFFVFCVFVDGGCCFIDWNIAECEWVQVLCRLGNAVPCGKMFKA